VSALMSELCRIFVIMISRPNDCSGTRGNCYSQSASRFLVRTAGVGRW
jgi:hypothetical protein